MLSARSTSGGMWQPIGAEGRTTGRRADRFKAHARTATPDEKPELWKLMTERWPAYDEYQDKTNREIPVVVLEREE